MLRAAAGWTGWLLQPWLVGLAVGYFIAQTLFRYRLLDVNEVLGRMVVLATLVLILAAIYGLLVAWVPPDFIDLANRGIEGNPEQCIMWLDTLDDEFVQSLRRLNVLSGRP